MSNTSAILDFAAAPHTLPPEVRADAVRLLADTLAVGAAGAASPEAQMLLPAVQGWGTGDEARLLARRLPELVEACPERLQGSRRGPSSFAPPSGRKDGASTGSASRKFRTSAPSAAFFNGFAIHCLEWDAVHEPAVVHALSVVTAALLAASDRAGGSDPQGFLTALAVGVDVASGLGLSATGPMRFFRPATAGVIGASLAVARLEGLSRAQMADVLGLAYSFAGGTMQAHVEASIALPLQIANAARAAVNAVDLVKAGMDGPRDALEGPFGYAALIEPLDLPRYTDTLGQVWRISEVSTKPYPSGRASHGALGALHSLSLQNSRHPGESRDKAFLGPSGEQKSPAPAFAGVTIEDIAKIELFAPPLIHRLIGRPYAPGAPMSYNRLCLGFLAPLMLRDGHIDPRLTATIPELAGKVTVAIDGNPDGNALSPQRLVVTMSDGSTIERRIDANPGSPDAPLTAAKAAAKHDLCRALAPDADGRIFDAALAFATEPQ